MKPYGDVVDGTKVRASYRLINIALFHFRFGYEE
jgi:hypothetical protein